MIIEEELVRGKLDTCHAPKVIDPLQHKRDGPVVTIGPVYVTPTVDDAIPGA